MAVTTLQGTKWTLNTSIVLSMSGNYNLVFLSNETTYKLFKSNLFTSLSYDNTTVYTGGAWTDNNYKEIYILGGSSCTNSGLISFFTNNATQIPMTDKEIFEQNMIGINAYLNQQNSTTGTHTIGEMSQLIANMFIPSGVYNISSNGSYLIDTYRSVLVAVTPNLQNKTVTPTTFAQSITYDSAQGYAGLNTVTVNAVTSSIDADITAGNIKQGVDILGVTGTFTSDANAVVDDLLLNKTAYVNGVKLTGTIATYDGTVVVPNNTISFSITDGVSLSPYQADAGMTWSQWVASNYNDGSYAISNNYIEVIGGGGRYIVNQTPSDVIVANTTYTITGGGSND